ncbi:hypothetical protein FS837_004392, partial [Tulasnella sp. UAMH 9824]
MPGYISKPDPLPSSINSDRPASASPVTKDDSAPTDRKAAPNASAGGIQPPIVYTSAVSLTVGDGPPTNISAGELSKSLTSDSRDRSALTSSGSTQHIRHLDSNATRMVERPKASPFPNLVYQSAGGPGSSKKPRRLRLVLGAVAVFVIVAAAVAVPVAMTQRKKSSSGPSASFTG